MAKASKAPKSPEHRRLIKFEKAQCLRLSALTYLVISMTNTRIYMVNSSKTTADIGMSLSRKRQNFVKVTAALVNSVLKEFDEYKDL